MHPLETARSSALPPELELQLLVGNCIEALLQLNTASGSDTDKRAVAVVAETADRFHAGAAELSSVPRTLAESASGLGLVDATRRAMAGTGSVREQLEAMADSLQTIAQSGAADDDAVGSAVGLLARLHEALSAARHFVPDEVRGLTRMA